MTAYDDDEWDNVGAARPANREMRKARTQSESETKETDILTDLEFWRMAKHGSELFRRDIQRAIDEITRLRAEPSWAEGIEEAAKVADEWCERNHWPNGVWGIAAGIRSLITQGSATLTGKGKK